MKRVIGVIGPSGSGKTTLISRLVNVLLPCRITVVKRSHHPEAGLEGGKDTDRYLEAGACNAVLVTPLRMVRFSSARHEELTPLPIAEVVAIESDSADLVIVESGTHEGSWPRLLLHRAGMVPADPIPPRVVAVVTDAAERVVPSIEQFDPDEIESIARFVIRITA